MSRLRVRSKFKVTIVGPISYQITSIVIHVNQPSHSQDMAISKFDLPNPCQLTLAFLRSRYFKIWPWKSKIKVMGEVKSQGQNVGLSDFLSIQYLSLLSHDAVQRIVTPCTKTSLGDWHRSHQVWTLQLISLGKVTKFVASKTCHTAPSCIQCEEKSNHKSFLLGLKWGC